MKHRLSRGYDVEPEPPKPGITHSFSTWPSSNTTIATRQQEKDQRNEQKRGTDDKNRENCKPVRLCSLSTPTQRVVSVKHRQEYKDLRRSCEEIVHSGRTQCRALHRYRISVEKRRKMTLFDHRMVTIAMLLVTVVNCDLELQLLHVVNVNVSS